MSQVSKYPIQKEVYNEIFDTFLKTIASLKTKDQVLSFFTEFLTPTERIMFSKRLAAGLLISEGYDYKKIKYILKISTSTISTFSANYKYGSGYRKVVDKIKLNNEIQEFLLNIGENIAKIGRIGGKGSDAWKSVYKDINRRKKKLLR